MVFGGRVQVSGFGLQGPGRFKFWTNCMNYIDVLVTLASLVESIITAFTPVPRLFADFGGPCLAGGGGGSGLNFGTPSRRPHLFPLRFSFA